METIAFYRETIIKTYGFLERAHLCMVTFEVPCTRMGDWGDDLSGLASRLGASLLLLAARPTVASTLRLHLILDETETGHLPGDQLRELWGPFGEQGQIIRPVELLFFQGPHFGDRYGIASQALNALAANDTSILAMICAGASVFLVLPEGKTPSVREALGQAFMTPETAQQQ